MLFQPTNITPSSFAGVGGDLVDATQGMTITWQVNGTSPIYKYRISIYENTSTSTALLSTGVITLPTPVYPTDGMGNPQNVTATISAADLANAGITNGNEYKYVIWQFWSNSNSDNVKQYGENFFVCQSAPTVSITTSALTSPNASITGTWNQSEGVGMDWVRWTVAMESDPTTVILDSGVIHTQVLQFDYSGWLPSITDAYYVTLEYQLQNGYHGSVSQTIPASWWHNFIPMSGNVTAERMAGCEEILVRYPVPAYLYLQNASQVTATASGGVLTVPSAETLTWSGEIFGGESVEGCLVWCGKPAGAVTLTATGAFTSGGTTYTTMTINAAMSGAITATLSGNGTTTKTLANVGDLTDKVVTIIAGGDTWYVVVRTLGTVTVNGTTQLLPTTGRTVTINGADTVTAGTMRIIVNGQNYDLTETVNTQVYEIANPFTDGTVSLTATTALSLTGAQECYYFGFTAGAPEGTLLDTLTSGSYDALTFDGNWLFLSDFSNTSTMASMGSVFYDPDTMSAIDSIEVFVYRKESTATVMEKLFLTTDQDDMGALIDYGAVNGKTYVYTVYYYLYYTSNGTQYLYYAGKSSDAINVCGWDWTVTTATADDNGAYHMTGVYRFGLNLGTEAISNNNVPMLMQNFTRYPTRQGVSANYRTGTLTAYIGGVDRENNVYIDTAAQAEAVYAISTSQDGKFLRTRKGEMWKIDTGAATTMNVGDKYREQPYTATLTWAETGSTDGISVISVPSDAAWPL